MKKLVLVAILTLTLSACASPILMRNPDNNEIAQCYSPGDIFRRYAERDNCVESYQKLGWVKAEGK